MSTTNKSTCLKADIEVRFYKKNEAAVEDWMTDLGCSSYNRTSFGKIYRKQMDTVIVPDGWTEQLLLELEGAPCSLVSIRLMSNGRVADAWYAERRYLQSC